MKRVLSVLLALILCLSMVACGGFSGEVVKKPVDVAPGSDPQESQETEQADKPEVTIEETVLVDMDGVKITAKSLEVDAFFGSEIKLLIENNSGKDLTFQCGHASVNGYMMDPMMSVDVVNGKKANDSLTFMESDFEACGIEAIADIEIAFHIFDTGNWDTYLDTDQIQIKTSIADIYEYTYDDSGELAYDKNGVKIVIKGLAEEDSFLGPSVVVYIENNSDKDITVQTNDTSINGFMIDAIFSCNVAAGKRAVDTITFMESDLEENDITAIENVELSFHAINFDDWETIFDTEIITITF